MDRLGDRKGDIRALGTFYEQCPSLPHSFTRGIGEIANIRYGFVNDIDRYTKLGI